MMKVKYLIILMMFAGVTFSSCERDELFEREQYKKVIALISDDGGFNIFEEEHNLAHPESHGYISAFCGGSLPTDRDINIAVVEDDELLSNYNLISHDVDESKYARKIPSDCYDIASYNINIPKGERTGLMDIKLRLHRLSPDSVYFIPFKIDRFSTYELNTEKRTVLYRVYMKNFYATNRTPTDYNARGMIDSVNVIGSKRMHPAGGNSVRIMAGSLSSSPDSSPEVFNSGAIRLTVDEDKRVTIAPWKDIEVKQVDGNPEYPNTFQIFDDGYTKYKTFLLNYEYVYNGTRYSVQEELRLEYDEKKDKETW